MIQKDGRKFEGIWIPSVLWLRDDLSVIEKCLIAEIQSLDKDVGCYASDEYLANFAGVTKGRLANILSGLRSKGLIKTVAFDGRHRYLKQSAYAVEGSPNENVNPAPALNQPSRKSEGSLHEKVNPLHIEENKEYNKEDIPEQPAAGFPLPEKKRHEIYSPCFDSVVKIFRFDPREARNSPGRILKAIKALKQFTPEITPEDIAIRAKRYVRAHPKWEFTLEALVKHWPELAQDVRPEGEPHYITVQA